MNISPVSSVSFKSNRTNFTSRNDTEGSPVKELRLASRAKAAPVIVLMAMNPSLLNAATLQNINADEFAEPKVYVTKSNAAKNNVPTYVWGSEEVVEPQVAQLNKPAPYNWGIFNIDHIKDTMKASIYDMVFTQMSTDGANQISSVYLVRESNSLVPATNHPFRVEKLICHTPPNQETFFTVLGSESVFEKGSTRPLGIRRREIKIQMSAVDKLQDLMMNNGKWRDKTGITAGSSTSPTTMEPVIIYSAY